MGHPAFQFAENAMLAGVDPDAVDGLKVQYRELFDRVRRSPPAEGSPEEDAMLFELSLLSFATLQALGSTFAELLRSGVNEALNELVAKEIAAAEDKRKGALRHIQHAVTRYGVVMESYAAVLASLGASSMAARADEVARLAARGTPIPDDERLVLRLQLDVFVALDVLDASLQELSYWAFRAGTDARRVEAMPTPALPAGFRGELARERAKRSWLNWDAAEIAKELAPWTRASQ
jgi:hypothetical protein